MECRAQCQDERDARPLMRQVQVGRAIAPDDPDVICAQSEIENLGWIVWGGLN